MCQKTEKHQQSGHFEVSVMSDRKRKKDARISSVELKMLGLKPEGRSEDSSKKKSDDKKHKASPAVAVAAEEPKKKAKKEETKKEERRSAEKKGKKEDAAKEAAPAPELRQSKISDFVATERRYDVSFDGRQESFNAADLAVMATFLQAKHALSKPQLALAVELWNSNPSPDAFSFASGENEGRSITLSDMFALGDVDHIMFREKGASRLVSTATVNILPVHEAPSKPNIQKTRK